ncbi:MAG TPA: flagellin [Methylocella sp.]|nr:flagellin [Methylocella sp.]
MSSLLTSSLLTNTSAMTALQALNQTEASLSQTENQVATGLSITNASDSPSYWSIATQMNSDVGALGAVSSALGESQSMVATMSAAMVASISVMDAIKNDLVTASQPGANLTDIQTDITAQQNSLLSIGSSSTFNGENFLETAGGNVNLVASYDSTSGVSFLTIDTTNTALFGTQGAASTTGILGQSGAAYTSASVLTLNITSATSGDLANMLKDVNTAIASITTANSTLGGLTTNLSTQSNYISNLSDSLTTGVGSLIDANMNEASTKLAALQVQQQLGIQALGIANSNTQLILKLFG